MNCIGMELLQKLGCLTEACPAASTNSQKNDIGLKLSRSDLYPPLLNPELDAVGITTLQPVEFGFTLNGVSGEVAGITLSVGSMGGAIFFTREFITHYSGSWPARLEVQAYQDGQQVANATVLLHDTANMVVSHGEVGLTINPVNVPFAEDLLIPVRPVFFDGNDVMLPPAEIAWELLVQPFDGVVLEGNGIRVSPGAATGEVTVTAREQSGVQASAQLVLIPEYNMGLSLQPADLYPPLMNDKDVSIRCEAEQAWEEPYITITINGVGGTFPGVAIASDTIYINRNFILNYQGNWPVELKVRAIRDGQIIGMATCWLHDTRELVVDKVDIVLSPSDEIKIPKPGEAPNYVIAAPRFYDKNGVPVQHMEVIWTGEMVDPIPGVEQVKHVFYVTDKASAGEYRVGLIVQIDPNQPGPDDIKRATVVKLVP